MSLSYFLASRSLVSCWWLTKVVKLLLLRWCLLKLRSSHGRELLLLWWNILLDWGSGLVVLLLLLLWGSNVSDRLLLDWYVLLLWNHLWSILDWLLSELFDLLNRLLLYISLLSRS